VGPDVHKDHRQHGRRIKGTSAAANCASAAANDNFCGIVNANDGTVAPWPYTDKSGNHTYLNGEFFEGGVNLTALGLGDRCTTATLKDFALGSFGACGATLTTHSSITGSTSIGTVNECFTVTPVTPAPATAAGADVPERVGRIAATGRLPVVRADRGWREARWAVAAVSAHSDRGRGERDRRAVVRSVHATSHNIDCSDANEDVVVNPVPSSMTSAQSFIPNDSATVTATQGGNVAGSVKFEAFQSNDCSGTAIVPGRAFSPAGITSMRAPNLGYRRKLSTSVGVGVAGCLAHAGEDPLGDVGGGVERGQLEVLLLAEVHGDERVQPVQQLLQRVEVAGVGRLEALDAGDDRLMVVDHRDRRVGEADERCPLGVEDVLLGLGVRDQRAAQETEDPVAKRVALRLGQARHLACGVGEVLDVLVQLLVLVAEGLGGTHGLCLSVVEMVRHLSLGLLSPA
jgi:hypothetical protein